MPRRTNEFQKTALQIQQALSKSNMHIQESAMIKEKGFGTEREIDILITTHANGIASHTAIECRAHKNKQGVEWVDSLIGKFSNLELPIDRIIAISQKKYSAAAIKKAAIYNIELITLEDASHIDWVKKITPDSIQFLGFENRPIHIGYYLEAGEVLHLEFTFEGKLVSTCKKACAAEAASLKIWNEHANDAISDLAGEAIKKDWSNLIKLPCIKKYWEVKIAFSEEQVLAIPGFESISYDEILFGVATLGTSNTSKPSPLAMGDSAIFTTNAEDNKGDSIKITMVSDNKGVIKGVGVGNHNWSPADET